MKYRKIYQTEVEKRLKPVSDHQILTLDDIQKLPEPVQKYLIYSGRYYTLQSVSTRWKCRILI